ncbi:MAG TPA: outer membrane beta-barrel protein [Beijerinckiaceae bacterium]|nr:outer membrane beta-barrel protein [Beijerinckiaceae bacterium]
MRRSAVLMVSAFLATGAQAADYLRGPLPEPVTRAAPTASYDWSGTYFGAHYNFGSMSFNNYDLSGTAFNSGITNTTLRTNLATAHGNTLFGSANGNRSGYGVFLGVNTQWDDVVLGLEGEYSRVGARANSRSTITGTFPAAAPAGTFDYNLTANARTTIDDYFALKARAGWAIDRTLLYATLGIAMANVTRQTTLTGTYEEYNVGPPRATISGVVPVDSATKKSMARWGFATGLGAEYALTDAVLLRGEWQYLGFGSMTNLNNAGKNGYYSLNTVRAGVAAKF